MSYTRRCLLSAATLSAATVATGACSSDRPQTRRATDKVTYVTGLGSFGREGFAWVAADKGFFRDENIEVKIVAGAAGDFNTKLVASGQAQFAEIDYSGVLLRAGAGAFASLRCVAALNANTTIAVMTLIGRGIAGPLDLKGKTVFQAQGSVIMRLWPGYAKLAGIDAGSVKWVEVAATNLPALLASGQVPAIGQFVVGAPAIAEAAKRPLADVVTLPFSRHLSDLYGNVLITSAELSKSNRDLVRRFTRALLRGLDYAVNNPQECAAILHQAVPATNPDTAAAEMRLLKPYVTGASGGAPMGVFEPVKVARSVALMQSLNLLSHMPAMDAFIDFTAVAGGPTR